MVSHSAGCPPHCPHTTTMRRDLPQERRMRRSRCGTLRFPANCALSRTLSVRAAAKQHRLAPDLARIWSQGSQPSGEPTTTAFRHTCRRLRPPEHRGRHCRLSHPEWLFCHLFMSPFPKVLNYIVTFVEWCCFPFAYVDKYLCF